MVSELLKKRTTENSYNKSLDIRINPQILPWKLENPGKMKETKKMKKLWAVYISHKWFNIQNRRIIQRI